MVRLSFTHNARSVEMNERTCRGNSLRNLSFHLNIFVVLQIKYKRYRFYMYSAKYNMHDVQ